MAEIGAYEAKAQLFKLLDRVAEGERIAITRHGVPVAMLVPVRGHDARPVTEVIAAMRELRRGSRLGGLSLRAIRDEGRR